MSMKEAMELRSSKTEGDDEAEEEDKDTDEEE
jgi:hypothetical protein